MNQKIRLLFVACVLLISCVGTAVALQCPTVYHQVIWLEQGGQSYKADQGPSEEVEWGKTITVHPGELVRIRTLIRNPNSRLNGFQPIVTYENPGKQNRGLVRIESDSQKPEVQRLGMIEMRILKEGSTGLIYRIENLDHASQKAPQKALGNKACSSAQIRIVSSSESPGSPTPPSSAELGFERTALLFDAILLRELGEGEAPLYVEQLRSPSFRDLLDVARQIAASSESKTQVPERLAAELGGTKMTPETRTSRMLEVMVGQISVRDRLWEGTFQLLSRNQVADAVEQALRDPRFMERHGELFTQAETKGVWTGRHRN